MNIGDLYAETLKASSAAADLILVTPDKYTGFTPSTKTRNTVGFKFQSIGEEVLNLQSDITDHFVENNTARQDHIALRPITITVSGYVGELNDITPDALGVAQYALNKLEVLDSYLPSLTNTARRAFNMAKQVYSLGEKIKDASMVAAGIEIKTKQQTAFNDLYKMWQERTLFWVHTPFGQFENMAIQSLNAVQNGENKYISDFTVTFKQIRYTQVYIQVNNRTDDTTSNQGSTTGTSVA